LPSVVTERRNSVGFCAIFAAITNHIFYFVVIQIYSFVFTKKLYLKSHENALTRSFHNSGNTRTDNMNIFIYILRLDASVSLSAIAFRGRKYLYGSVCPSLFCCAAWVPR